MMRYVQQSDSNRKQIVKCFLALFFLNRIISTDLFYGVTAINEVYVLVSEVLTVWYFLRWLYKYSQKKHMYINEVGCIVWVLVYFILLALITLFESGNLRRVMMSAYPIVGTLCFLDVKSDKNAKNLIKGYMYFLFTMVAWNFIDMLFVKKVLSNSISVFLIGGRNQLAIILAMAFSVFHLNKELEIEENKLSVKNKLFYALFYILLLVTALLSRSATTLIAILMIYVLYALKFVKQKNIVLNPFIIILGYIFVWLGLIVYRLQYLFEDLIVNRLHKDLTLSHRTILWDKALEMIKLKPYFGYGMSDSVNVFSVNHDYTGGNNAVLSTLSGHNQILQMLYYGGIVLVLVFVMLYLVCCEKRRRNNNAFYLLFLSVIVILVVWLSEVPSEYEMFTCLGLCYYSQRFERMKSYNAK